MQRDLSNLASDSSHAGSRDIDELRNQTPPVIGSYLKRRRRRLTEALQRSFSIQGVEAGLAPSHLGWQALQPAMDAPPIPGRQLNPVAARAPYAANPVGGYAKRVLDIIVASLALVVLSPLMIIIAILIRSSMGGPVVFAHPRIGHNGKTFRCYKFRTMVNGADHALSGYLAANPSIAREWSETRKLAHDPRVTNLGQFLRKASLDELPQLFNVLRGEMSCVGPRPIVAAELERYGSDVSEYLRARPGLTGLWQVSGRSRVSYASRVALDTHYARNWSFVMDVMILVRTIPALLKFDETA